MKTLQNVHTILKGEMVMFVVHHNDDDGRCAAAIVQREFTSFETVDEHNYIEYGHSGEIAHDFIEELRPMGDSVYIVDLALDDVIIQLIRDILAQRPNTKIIHIDHHETTFKRMENLSDEDKVIMSNENITKFYRKDACGALLTYIYSCMSEDERAHIDEMYYDFTEEGSHFAFFLDTPQQRIYRIPMMLRYINDWDTWTHAFKETKYFNLGFGCVGDKHPMNPVWDILYGNDITVIDKYLKDGMAIYSYKESENRHKMKFAHEYNISWVTRDGEFKQTTMLCLNSNGNSTVFGDKINEYDVVCLYMYHGDTQKWYYSIYSTRGIDVSEIAEYYGGGGHPGASGFQIDDLIFLR
jgi:hypothetical protein